MEQPIRVLRITDDKPGHLAQSAGLVAALGRLARVDVTDVPALPAPAAIAHWLTARMPPTIAANWQEPASSQSLVVCCGHATHLTALAARRACGGRLVALMRPSLPIGLFDLVVAPRHDDLPESSRVLLTEGVLNPLTAEGAHRPDVGLILIGGPSRHHDWDKSRILGQVEAVARDRPHTHWILTTSRRTPPTTTEALSAMGLPNLQVIPLAQTGPGWVVRHLADAGTAWISEDSVSMVYEALTAGVAVGLLAVPARAGRGSRVARGVAGLIQSGRVARLTLGTAIPELPTLPPLAEADRIARIILDRWFTSADRPRPT